MWGPCLLWGPRLYWDIESIMIKIPYILMSMLPLASHMLCTINSFTLNCTVTFCVLVHYLQFLLTFYAAKPSLLLVIVIHGLLEALNFNLSCLYHDWTPQGNLLTFYTPLCKTVLQIVAPS